jgi:uncharacterized protein (DUF488 family)
MTTEIPSTIPAIWTIGHSVHAADKFLALLATHRIQALADIRRFPGSRRHPQFGADSLSAALAEHGIQYQHFPDLGGRRSPRPNSPNFAWRNAAFRGYADYMETDEFQQAAARLLDQAERLRTVMMCAEALWWQCHRALVSDYCKSRGWTVWHIGGDGKTVEHPYTQPAQVANGRLTYRGQELWPVNGHTAS